MSWLLQATGTKVGAVSQLDNQKIYGTASPEEQAAFDKARNILKDLIVNHGYECSPPGPDGKQAVTVFKANASGHGPQITNIGLAYEIVWLS